MDSSFMSPLNSPRWDSNVEDYSIHFLVLARKVDLLDNYLATNTNLDVNNQNNQGNTPLHLAALKGFDDAINVLVKYKADLSITNNSGILPLFVALRNNHKSTANLIATHMQLSWTSKSLTHRDNKRMSILHYLCFTDFLLEWYNKYRLFRYLEDKNNIESTTPLLLASYFSLTKAVSDLISLGANPLNSNDNGQIAIMFALRTGNISNIHLLFPFLKQHNIKDNKGLHLIHYAFESGNVKIVIEYLKLKGKKDCSGIYFQSVLHEAQQIRQFNFTTNELKDNDGYNPIHYAIKQNNIDLLLLNGWSPLFFCVLNNATQCFEQIVNLEKPEYLLNSTLHDDIGNTVFHYATAGGQVSIIDYLTTLHGAYDLLHQTNNIKENVLHIAAFVGQSALFLRLINNYNFNPLTLTNTCKTPLHYASLNIHQNRFAFTLLQKYFKTLPKDSLGRTPLHIACCCKNHSVVQILLCHYTTSIDDVDNDGKTALHYAILFDSALCVDELLKFNPNQEILDNKNRKAINYVQSIYCYLRLIQKPTLCVVGRFMYTKTCKFNKITFKKGKKIEVVWKNNNFALAKNMNNLMLIPIDNCVEMSLYRKELENVMFYQKRIHNCQNVSGVIKQKYML
ncbi:Ankyrin repeat protein [Entamoeba marina]